MVTLWQQVLNRGSLSVEVKGDESWPETAAGECNVFRKMGINLVPAATAGGRAEEAACPCQGGIWLPLCLLCKCDPFYFSPVLHIRLVFVTQSRDTGCRSCPATAQLGLELASHLSVL